MISDVIEQMLLEMLREEGGSLELKRNDLAQRLGCVPSQINYVITSRFTPEKGYVIESRRGGGGYVRITKKVFHKDEYLMHLFCSVGEEIDGKTAGLYILDMVERRLLTAREGKLVNTILGLIDDDRLRAEALKKTVLAAI
ncbi:MAG: CtsR family transcriptional regulator [Ruminococcaceae bacterium]|nr:CtsR family transcriptional regulator [Oscillospiraceae bacterium]